MLSRISKRLHTWARGWVILIIIAGFVVLINIPVGDPELISQSLDGRIGYTPQEAFSAVASYGVDGRTQMIWIHLADFILIALYTSMFCLVLSWLLQRGFPPDSRMQQLNVVPMIGGCFDVLENIWILTLLLAYPAQPQVIAWLSTISTTCKYSMGVVIVLLLVIGLGKSAANRFRVQEAAAVG
ncbi:MAG: hypothetical protein JXA25_08655 [Anaerolineales bacterium]|nr:hypothetical protein [Anaerolineales bacterium]